MSGFAHLAKSAPLSPRVTLRDQATDRLRDWILDGTLPAGTAVPERDLSAALGISRTPLKEALRHLQTEGLVTYGSSFRPHVSDPDPATLAQTQDVLCMLETAAAEQAVAAGVDISALVAVQSRLAELPPEADAIALDMAFHRTLVGLADNPVLAETHHRLSLMVWRARAAALTKRKARKSMLRDHDAILAALHAGAAKPIRRALRQHLDAGLPTA